MNLIVNPSSEMSISSGTAGVESKNVSQASLDSLNKEGKK
jgi:hypothetical protein